MTPDQRAGEGFLAVLGGVPEDAERTVYLCHLYCELGATPAIEAFRLIHDFLRENPNEVIVLLVEDFVDTEDAVAVLERSGLADHTLSWQRGQPLPTLGEMISRDDNVVVLAENAPGSAPWYIPAYDMLQDTPYTFAEPEEFSCDVGRGAVDNPLLMLNHWITVDPPSRAVAAEANGRDVLLERAPSVARPRRGQLPNILAVDFYADGDVFAVVDELNGVGPP